MAGQIESASPRFIVFVHVFVSWILEDESENFIFEWFEKYGQKYYDKVGVVDILTSSPTVYRWGSEAADYQPLSDAWILVFERKN
jgi:hypothetical protein